PSQANATRGAFAQMGERRRNARTARGVHTPPISSACTKARSSGRVAVCLLDCDGARDGVTVEERELAGGAEALRRDRGDAGGQGEALGERALAGPAEERPKLR